MTERKAMSILQTTSTLVVSIGRPCVSFVWLYNNIQLQYFACDVARTSSSTSGIATQELQRLVSPGYCTVFSKSRAQSLRLYPAALQPNQEAEYIFYEPGRQT